MFIIPGIVISVLTFPGVIAHEAAHMLFCRLRKVPVFDVRFFQFDMKTAGYVVHGNSDNFTTIFLISIGPFILNTLLCLLICFPAALPLYLFDEKNVFTYILLWLGVSMGMNAFPSNQDAQSIMDKAKMEIKKKNPFAYISFPLVGLIYIANLLKFFWFDAIYGVFIGLILPSLIFKTVL